MNHLYIISGKANTGKTHTCWLLYTMLSCLGEVKLFENLGFPNAAIPYSFVLGHLQRKMLHPRTRSFRDFRAIIELKGKRIALFSAGDQLENNHNDILSFLKNEQWAHEIVPIISYAPRVKETMSTEVIIHIIVTDRYMSTSGRNFRSQSERYTIKNHIPMLICKYPKQKRLRGRYYGI